MSNIKDEEYEKNYKINPAHIALSNYFIPYSISYFFKD